MFCAVDKNLPNLEIKVYYAGCNGLCIFVSSYLLGIDLQITNNGIWYMPSAFFLFLRHDHHTVDYCLHLNSFSPTSLKLFFLKAENTARGQKHDDIGLLSVQFDPDQRLLQKRSVLLFSLKEFYMYIHALI